MVRRRNQLLDVRTQNLFSLFSLSSLFFFCGVSVFISNLTIQRQYFPNDDDQTGAAKALMRLQDTYQLDTNAISTGELPGL